MRLFLYKFVYLLLFLLLFLANIYNQAKSNDNSFWDEYKANVTKNYVSSLGWFNTSKARKNLETPQIPKIINLKQKLLFPKVSEKSHEENIYDWEKIWKHQFGSWIILSAEIEKNNYSSGEYKLVFELYRIWTVWTIETFETKKMNSWVWEFELKEYPWAWQYYWKVGIKSDSWLLDDSYDFYKYNLYFTLFERFEPYPYGYSFHNKWAAEWVLDWWVILDIRNLTPKIVPWRKWDIFKKTFDISSFENDEEKMISAFKSIWLNKEKIDLFQWWNCYGMAVSAAMQYSHSWFIKNNFPWFSQEIWNWTIRNNIKEWKTVKEWDRMKWKDYNDILETIYSFQLAQKSIHHIKAENNWIQNPNKILRELRDNPNNTYILSFFGKKKEGLLPLSKKSTAWHTVVPYKVEWKKIYFWDNNYPYPNRWKYKWYEQYIEVIEDSDWEFSWKAPSYSRTSFGDIYLVNIDEIYDEWKKSTPGYWQDKSAPIWYWDNDTAYSLSWSSDIYVSDSLGRISWFKNWKILEQIPWVDVIIPLNANPNGETIENTFKQIYLPKKKDLTIKVSWEKKESYDLMIAWWNYYTELSGVETSPWQVDEFISTIDKLEIDFDDKKTWDYNLIIKNFWDHRWWITYSPKTKVKKEAQEYSINWQWVLEDSVDSIILKTDTNNDWVFDKKEKSSWMSIRKPIKTSSKNSNAQIIKRFKEKITKYLEKKIIRREIKINSKVYKILVVKSSEEYIKKLEKKLSSVIKKLKVRQEDIKEFVLLINKIILNREIHRNSTILETYQNQLDKQFKKYVKDLKKLVNKK